MTTNFIATVVGRPENRHTWKLSTKLFLQMLLTADEQVCSDGTASRTTRIPYRRFNRTSIVRNPARDQDNLVNIGIRMQYNQISAGDVYEAMKPNVLHNVPKFKYITKRVLRVQVPYIPTIPRIFKSQSDLEVYETTSFWPHTQYRGTRANRIGIFNRCKNKKPARTVLSTSMPKRPQLFSKSCEI
jgi:hypothetical protein